MARTFPKIPFRPNERRSKYRRLIASNLLLGLIRGAGMAVGFSSFALVVLAIIQIIPLHKMPVIGAFIQALVEK